MARNAKPLSQQYYEEVETLKAGGMSNADAVREVAKKHNKQENAVRGGIHQYKQRAGLGGGSGTRRGSRRSTTSVDDYIANARKALESARDLVDREVDEA